jgi:Activator of Hsp90 ATPase homolog 1-like protein
MSSYDWGRFTQRINVNAPAKSLYDAFATRFGMESWFLRECEYKHADESLLSNDEQVKTGDVYAWLWHGWLDTTAEMGEFLTANDKDELQFVFGKAGTVTIKIYAAENENIVELTQENIPADEESKFNFHVGCSTGWVFYLANLKSIMEGGIDLRNKNVLLTGVLNA